MSPSVVHPFRDDQYTCKDILKKSSAEGTSITVLGRDRHTIALTCSRVDVYLYPLWLTPQTEPWAKSLYLEFNFLVISIDIYDTLRGSSEQMYCESYWKVDSQWGPLSCEQAPNYRGDPLCRNDRLRHVNEIAINVASRNWESDLRIHSSENDASCSSIIEHKLWTWRHIPVCSIVAFACRFQTDFQCELQK